MPVLDDGVVVSQEAGSSGGSGRLKPSLQGEVSVEAARPGRGSPARVGVEESIAKLFPPQHVDQEVGGRVEAT